MSRRCSEPLVIELLELLQPSLKHDTLKVLFTTFSAIEADGLWRPALIHAGTPVGRRCFARSSMNTESNAIYRCGWRAPHKINLKKQNFNA